MPSLSSEFLQSLRPTLRAVCTRYSLPRQTLEALLAPAPWQEAVSALPQTHDERICTRVLECCAQPFSLLAPSEPDKGWLSFLYAYVCHLVYPEAAFTEAARPWAAAADFYLAVLQFVLDKERSLRAPDPLRDFIFLSEEEYRHFDRADEYRIFLKAWREQYIYEMLRMAEEATPFRTLGHIAGVHYIAMEAARGLHRAGLPVDLALASGAAAGHDLGKFGCKPGERVPYLHYYYTDQWFRRMDATAIGAIAANHSTWDLELDNLSAEALCLIYADFRVKQERGPDGEELTRIYGLDDSFHVILSKLDNVDEAKKNRYRFVYARLHDFEDYMRTLGVDVDLTGHPQLPPPMPEVPLRTVDQAIRSLLFQGMEYNIKVMDVLIRDQSFANLLESARSEKDWRSIRSYLDIFGEYSIYLHPRQKVLTLDFLYELLMNREGDIRRRAADLLGQVIAQYNAGYRKERPVGTPDQAEQTALELWEGLLNRIISPDAHLITIQKTWIRYTLKLVVQSLFEKAPAQDAPELFRVLLDFYRRRDWAEMEAFALLDNLYSLPTERCSGEQLDTIIGFAEHYFHHGSPLLRIASTRFFKQMSGQLDRTSIFASRISDIFEDLDGTDDVILQFLQYRIGQGMKLDVSSLERRLNREDVLNEIFLDNLKTGTPWLRKAVSIKLLADRAPHCSVGERLHIATHMANLVKVSENIVVRYDAGAALLRIAPLLAMEHRNEIAVELFKGLQTGDYEFSKYIPGCLGEFALWLPPRELDEMVQSLRSSLSSPNERVACVALDTVGVLLECHPAYSYRFPEKTADRDLRRRYLLGFLLAGLANHRPSVRQESLLTLGRLFSSQRLDMEEKKHLFGLCCRKLLFLLNENSDGAQGNYFRAAALTQICRFINTCGMDGALVSVEEYNKVAFFPGTFDPFTLGHKGIVRAIRNLGFEVYLAVDEFSWSKNAQPHLVRRQIVNMSVSDMFHVHIFPNNIPVNLTNDQDLDRLRSLFPGKKLYMVAGSDVIANASAYRAPATDSSIHNFNHVVFRRSGSTPQQDERDLEARRSIRGRVLDLTLPAELEDISSTRIRDNLDQGRDISQLIDPVVQEYIYSSSVYLRASRFKAGLVEAPGRFRVMDYPSRDELDTLIAELPSQQAALAGALPPSCWAVLEGKQGPAALGAFCILRPSQLMQAMGTPGAAAALRQKAGGPVLLLEGLWPTRHRIAESINLTLSELLAHGLEQGCTYAVWVPRSAEARSLTRESLARQGFVPCTLEDAPAGAMMCDMHQPVVLLRNLEATFKQPMAASPELNRVIHTTHARLQEAICKLYPGHLVLDLYSNVIQQKMAEQITAMNGVPSVPTTPRVLGPLMCVPFGKLLRGRVVPNTVTKTLHTDRVFEPDLSGSKIEAYPGYSDLTAQIQTIRSFQRPVILVDDLLHRNGRLRAVLPLMSRQGIEVRQVMMGILSGMGADSMARNGVPVTGIYNIPSMRYWFVDSTLYPFIGGDTVRRSHDPVSGLLPAINQILPYTYPSLEGCTTESLYDLSQVCLENARDIFRVLEMEYRRSFGRNLTLNRLGEAVVLPTCPDRGSCMRYDPNLPASTYLENDLEQLLRTRKLMK